MRRYFQVLILGVSGFVVAGCGDGGGGDSLQIVDPTTLPTTGDATYNGAIGFIVNDGSGPLTFSGDIELTTNFQNSAVTGDIDNFSDSNSDTYTGGFTLQNGDIDRTVSPASGFTIFADVDGRIENNTNSDTYDAAVGDTSLLADFFDDGSSTIPSTVRGELDGALDKNETGVPLFFQADGNSFTATR